MNNFDFKKYLAEGKLLKEAFYPEFEGETNDKINDIAIAVVDELESKLDSESSGILKGMDYYVGSDGMDNDEVEQGFTKWFIDLVKYLSKNNNEVTISSVEQDGKVFTPAITLKYLDNGKEDISWKLKRDLDEGKLNEAEMSFDSDIEGKTNKNDFAFWYRKGAMGEKQALKAQELLKQNGIDADYSKGPFYIDFSNSNVEQRAVMQLLRDAGLTNFVVTNTVEEGKLNEAMSPQDIVDIADTVAEEFTKESTDEGDFMIYSVGEMDVDDMTFELDTDTTAQTPERILKMSNLGVGEGWGGSFRINPKEEGYEVRNSEKGGLVAIIDGMGNFKMISADEARAEMGMADGEKTDFMQRRKETDDYIEEGEEEVKEIKSNKMKKSELKEMIKAAMSENARTDAEEEGYLDGMRDEKEDMKEAEDVEVEDNENIDVDIEKDVKIDDEESEVDIDVKASMPGESEDVEEVQALLMKAQEQARDLGDEKLTDQIGNTITYFTRAHVAGNVSEMDDMDVNVNTTEMEAELGLEEAKDEEVKENLNESMFPMWNKIK